MCQTERFGFKARSGASWGGDIDIEIIGEGLLFPEGPVIFEDGSLVFVEVLRGTLTRLWGDGRSEVVANLGGGPNGAALGPDGAIYVTNNGGFNWRRDDDGHPTILPGLPDSYEGGRIERVDLTDGSFERIYVDCDGFGLRGPNDLVFDRTGGIWFTDLGKRTPRVRDISGLYYARPDGSCIQSVHFGGLSFNGVGLSPDERTVYVADTLNARVWAYDSPTPGEVRPKGAGVSPAAVFGALPGEQMLDSLAVTEAGDVCVGTLINGGITTFRAGGAFSHLPLPDSHVTNICFGGPDRCDAFVTLSATGRIARLRWPEPGLALNFTTY